MNQFNVLRKQVEVKSLIVLAVIFLSVIGMVIVAGLLSKDIYADDYRDAIAAYELGNMEFANEKFKMLSEVGYKDSIAYAAKTDAEIKYNEAIEAYEKKEYDTALSLFAILGNYKEASRYKIAVILEYAEWINRFQK